MTRTGEAHQISRYAVSALPLRKIVSNGKVKVAGSHRDLSNGIAVNKEHDAHKFAVQPHFCGISKNAHFPIPSCRFVPFQHLEHQNAVLAIPFEIEPRPNPPLPTGQLVTVASGFVPHEPRGGDLSQEAA